MQNKLKLFAFIRTNISVPKKLDVGKLNEFKNALINKEIEAWSRLLS